MINLELIGSLQKKGIWPIITEDIVSTDYASYCCYMWNHTHVEQRENQ